ncbi:peptidoglycan recognition protein family protein [Dictyobacter aurantiacus]|uniref:N-acetylmuramoyl-L-alanine amidase n=1 Tax=Dictyobacter aurantiacus TaxID=1936993 RepID=A0A401Z933_9CHLR|nr:N-acetylmuramoyl-L-alanine amidase [Dictyobacter aurantiacus]GCE03374.1 N-acetylmuramoyl-L-alanine amidase [Dictyobacter aurantiacus]
MEHSSVARDPQTWTLDRRTLIKLGAGTVAALGGAQLILCFSPDVSAAPTISGTTAWGAQPARAPITVFSYKPTTILVHHTDTPNTTDNSQSAAYALARSIQQSHFANGWIDTGQHFTISRGGYIMEGRHQSLQTLQGGMQMVQGAHCPVLNDYAIGIEDEGSYNSILPPDVLWNSLINLCTYICQQYGLNANAIFGHRDFYNTGCPGTQLYGRLRDLRLQVLARLGQTLPARTWPLIKNGISGENVSTIQYLLSSHGYSTSVDGSFGSGTAASVTSFQSSKGLGADGIVGQQTWEALVTPLTNGSSGDGVKAVQSQLNSKGYACSVDGQFGPATMGQVQSFQRNMGLPVNGNVQTNTWCALVGGIVA